MYWSYSIIEYMEACHWSRGRRKRAFHWSEGKWSTNCCSLALWPQPFQKKLPRLTPRQFFSRNFVTLVANFEPKLKTWSHQIMFYTRIQKIFKTIANRSLLFAIVLNGKQDFLFGPMSISYSSLFLFPNQLIHTNVTLRLTNQTYFVNFLSFEKSLSN